MTGVPLAGFGALIVDPEDRLGRVVELGVDGVIEAEDSLGGRFTVPITEAVLYRPAPGAIGYRLDALWCWDHGWQRMVPVEAYDERDHKGKYTDHGRGHAGARGCDPDEYEIEDDAHVGDAAKASGRVVPEPGTDAEVAEAATHPPPYSWRHGWIPLNPHTAKKWRKKWPPKGGVPLGGSKGHPDAAPPGKGKGPVPNLLVAPHPDVKNKSYLTPKGVKRAAGEKPGDSSGDIAQWEKDLLLVDDEPPIPQTKPVKLKAPIKKTDSPSAEPKSADELDELDELAKFAEITSAPSFAMTDGAVPKIGDKVQIAYGAKPKGTVVDLNPEVGGVTVSFDLLPNGDPEPVALNELELVPATPAKSLPKLNDGTTPEIGDKVKVAHGDTTGTVTGFGDNGSDVLVKFDDDPDLYPGDSSKSVSMPAHGLVKHDPNEKPPFKEPSSTPVLGDTEKLAPTVPLKSSVKLDELLADEQVSRFGPGDTVKTPDGDVATVIKDNGDGYVSLVWKDNGEYEPDFNKDSLRIIKKAPTGPVEMADVTDGRALGVREPRTMPEPAGMLEVANWDKVGGQEGSQVGGTYQAPDGSKYYVKHSKSADHARNEVLAGQLYAAAGIETPATKLAEVGDGKLGTASPIIPNVKKDGKSKIFKDEAYKKELQAGFAVDAWLGNWDVAGATFDNVVTGPNGQPIRVDQGGALLFRAQGTPKGNKFGNSVDEWDTLRSHSKNPQAAKIFDNMTPEQRAEAAKAVTSIPHSKIDELVDAAGFDPATTEKLKQTLKARQADIAKRAAKDVEVAKVKVEEPKIPAPMKPIPDTSAGLKTGKYDKNGQELFVGNAIEYKAGGATFTGKVLGNAGTGGVGIEIELDHAPGVPIKLGPTSLSSVQKVGSGLDKHGIPADAALDKMDVEFLKMTQDVLKAKMTVANDKDDLDGYAALSDAVFKIDRKLKAKNSTSAAPITPTASATFNVPAGYYAKKGKKGDGIAFTTPHTAGMTGVIQTKHKDGTYTVIANGKKVKVSSSQVVGFSPGNVAAPKPPAPTTKHVPIKVARPVVPDGPTDKSGTLIKPNTWVLLDGQKGTNKYNVDAINPDGSLSLSKVGYSYAKETKTPREVKVVSYPPGENPYPDALKKVPKAKMIKGHELTGPQTYQAAPNASHLPYTTAESSAVKYYTGAGYHSINNQLRYNDDPTNTGLQNRIKNLDSLFEKAPPLTHDILVTRQVKDSNTVFGPVGSKVGKSFSDKAYLSTTSKVGGTGFGNTYVRVKVPAGVKVIRPNGIGTYGDAEAEVLLPRGMRFKVVTDEVVNGQRRLEMELIPE